MSDFAREDEFPGVVGLFQEGQELSSEESGEDLDVDEEGLFRWDPARAVSGQSTSGDDAMEVWVVEEGLGPGVEDGDESDVCAEVLGIGSELFEGLGSGVEEDTVEGALVSQGEGSELLRQGEDDVEVRGWQQVLFPVQDPSLSGEELTGGAMPVSAGVVGEGEGATVIALVEVAAQFRRSAGLDGAHGPEVLQRDLTGVSLPVCRAEGFEDFGDFRGGVHEAPPRLGVGLGGLSHRSRGFLTSASLLPDTWR